MKKKRKEKEKRRVKGVEYVRMGRVGQALDQWVWKRAKDRRVSEGWQFGVR